MSDFQNLLLSIVPSPLFGLLICVAGLLLLRPAQAVVGRRVEAALERSINNCTTSNILNRVVIFVVSLSSATGLLASSACYLLTDLPPPAVDPYLQHPFGPFVTRLFGYAVVWLCCIMPLLGYLVGLDTHTGRSREADVIELAARQLPFAVFLGLLPSWIWIGYAAFVDSSLAYKFTLPPLDADTLLWWYSWLPLTSLAWGILGYVVFLLFRWLWKLTAYIA